MYDEILFGLTSATSLVVALIFGAKLTRTGFPQRILWATSFAILSLVTAGVALSGLSFLSQPLVAPISSLIPGFMAAGLLWTWKHRVGSYFAMYIVATFLILLAAKLAAGAPTSLFVLSIHGPSGLVVFLLPTYLVIARKNAWSAILVGFGGLLIGVGGMGLATLSAGVPILPEDLVLALLAPIFFLMTVLFGLGLLATPGWGRRV